MDDSHGVPGPKSKSAKPKKSKPRKGKKPVPGDKMLADDDIPFEDDSEEDDGPSDDPEELGLKDRKKPRKTRSNPTGSTHGKHKIPDDVSSTKLNIYCYYQSIPSNI